MSFSTSRKQIWFSWSILPDSSTGQQKKESDFSGKNSRLTGCRQAHFDVAIARGKRNKKCPPEGSSGGHRQKVGREHLSGTCDRLVAQPSRGLRLPDPSDLQFNPPWRQIEPTDFSRVETRSRLFQSKPARTRRNAVASQIRPWDPEEGISPNTGIYRTGLGASVVTITRWPLVGALSITGFAIYILRKRVPRPKQAKAIPLPAEAIAT